MILNRLILAPVTVQKWEWLCPEHGPCQGRNAPFGRRGQGWADPYSTDEFAIKFKDFFRGRRGANRSKIRRDFGGQDRKSTRLNSSHQIISYAVFCLKKKKTREMQIDSCNSGARPQRLVLTRPDKHCEPL